MYPLHKEKYILPIETFYNFTYDRHADIFKKEKRSHFIYAIAMLIAAVATFAVNLISPSAQGDFVWMIMPIAFLALCASFVLKYNRADGQVVNKINKDYASKNYANKYYSLKFYEDKLCYTFGEQKEEVSYKEFKKYYEGKAYFAIYFHTGDLILMSDKCNVEKIKEIIANYKENVVKHSEQV